jgi:hypothetical protein
MKESIFVYEIATDDLKWIIENSNMSADFKKAASDEYQRRTSLGEVSNDVCKYKKQI